MRTDTSVVYRKRRVQQNCHCKAYPFVHRLGSGKCVGNDPGPFCGSCGEPCRVVVADRGIGSYEFWGHKGVDSRVEAESYCCGANVYSDAELKINYEGDN